MHHLPSSRPLPSLIVVLGILLCASLVACPGEWTEGSRRVASSSEGQSTTGFDGVAALAVVRTQVAFGPRVPGTPAHQQAGDWLEAELRRRADTLIVQRWTHRTVEGRSLPMRNILARFRPTASRRVLYLAHWDSRPKSDSDPDLSKRDQPVPGANDGGSGVAILVEVARVLARSAPTVGVDLLLVDGEDYGDFTTDTDVLIGSRYFAAHLPEPGYAPLFGVLWDMVGDADPVFEQEGHSVRGAPEVVQRVWSTAHRLGHGAIFTNRSGLAITDDHVPLLAAGLRVIDVIDLDYPWHHTVGDTPDRVASRSLQIVGDVAITLIRDLDPDAGKR